MKVHEGQAHSVCGDTNMYASSVTVKLAEVSRIFTH